MTIRKSNTKLTVDQILDGGADILEAGGWVTGTCFDSQTGGHCALGAVAQAVYPRANAPEIEHLSYVDTDEDVALWSGTRNAYFALTGRHADPRHVEAINFLAKRLGYSEKRFPLRTAVTHVFRFNDEHPDDEELRLVSSKRIVKRFRNAAEAYRKQQAKRAAK